MTTAATTDLFPAERVERGESPFTKARKRFFRHRLAMVGLVILTTMILMALFAPLLTQYSPIEINAGRVSLSVGLVAVTLSTLIGVLIGGLAGYAGGRLDMLLMRFTDMVMTFPSLVIIITVASVLGPSIYNTMLVIGMLTWTGTARIVRGQILSLREQQFVLEGMPWLWLSPGIMIALAVLSINFIGDGLRDAVDPRSLK